MLYVIRRAWCCLAAAGLLTQPAWAFNQEAGARFFSGIELLAIEQACQAQTASVLEHPVPSTALCKVVASRPRVLLALEGGARWMIGRQDESHLQPLDAGPLGADDLSIANSILKIPFFARWVECMERAVRGNAEGKCLEEIARWAMEVRSDRARQLLLAGIGARVQFLLERNPAWHHLVYSKQQPKPVALAMDAYRDMEYEKIRAIREFPRTDSDPLLAFSTVSGCGDAASGWADFQTPEPSQKTAHPVRGWRFTGSNSPKQVYDQAAVSGAGMATLYLSPEQHVVIRGHLDDKSIHKLQSVDNLKGIVEMAKSMKLDIFLSRPGTADVGVCKVEAP